MKLYQKTAAAGVIKILITIPVILEFMRQLIIKPLRRSLDPGAWKNDKKWKKFKKLEKLQMFSKISYIKILKNILLQQEAMRNL